MVMVRTNGEYIYIICKDEDQVQPVMDKMNTDTCYLSDYEEWDEDEDMKWILTFKVTEHDCNSHIGVCESCYELNPHCLKIFKKVPEVKTPEESSFFKKIGFSDNGVMLLFLFVFFLWFFDHGMARFFKILFS